MLQTLKQLLPPRPSVSGGEGGIREIIAGLMRPLCDEVRTDAMGNLICVKKGSDPAPRTVMLCAHMDEVGFIVTFIEESGFIRVAPLGGVNVTAAAGTRVVFENGTRGVLVETGDAPEKERPGAEHLVVDIGAADKKQAARRVRIGDCCAAPAYVEKLCGTRVCGRPLDDRVGCAVLIGIARAAAAPRDTLVYVFSVQEEVGCRGARPAAFAVAPDVALAFDVTGTGDFPGAKPMAVTLGKGAAIKVKDRSVICHRGLVAELAAAAERANVPVQFEILPQGGTDAGAVQMTGGGARTGAISVPARYTHTGVETIDLRDAQAAVSLALAYLA